MPDKGKPAAQLVLDNDVDYMFGLIKRVCIEVGPGIPCSPQELQRALIVKTEMEANLGADNVELEQTTLAPKACFGWFRWAGVATLLSLALFFTRQMSGFPLLLTGLSFVCILLANITLLYEFFLGREFIDPLFKKEISQNVIGRIRREGESAERIKRLLIVSGHHDSAPQFNWITYLGFGYYLTQLASVISLLAILIGAGTELFSLLLLGKSLHWAQDYMFWTSVLIAPLGFISGFFFLGSQKGGGTVPGAADNLSGCAVTLAIGRILARHPELIPPRTEIRLITFGSEEAITRGSLRYVERHIEELQRLDARVVNIDAVIDPKIIIFTSDGNGFTRHLPDVCGELARAASAADVPHSLQPFLAFGGATDALSFSRFKIKAATLFAMRVPEQMIRWYHTHRDDYTLYQNEKEGGTRGLRNALKICLEWIVTVHGAADERSPG